MTTESVGDVLPVRTDDRPLAAVATADSSAGFARWSGTSFAARWSGTSFAAAIHAAEVAAGEV
jgi:hypothetical protein